MIRFLVFLFAYTLSQFFRSFLAVVAPSLRVELGLTSADLANMSAAWFAVFALAQFPLGVALDRYGPRRIVPLIMLAGVAGAFLLAGVEGPAGAILALALIGLGCSPIYMGALYYFARTETAARFGFLSALLLGIGSAGNLLAATPLALATATFGWRATFVGLGAVMLASALVFLVVIRDPPPAEQPKAEQLSAAAALLAIMRLPRLWTLMPLLTLGYATVVVERGLWVGPYFAEVHRLGPVPLGNAVLAMAVSMSAGALIYGSLDRIFGRRKLFVALGSGLTAAGFAWLAYFPTPALLPAVAVMGFVGLAGLCHPLLFTHARTFYPEHLLGRGITFANFLTIGGAGLVQFVSGLYVERLQQSGLAAPEVYASLHAAFAITITVALAIYLISPVPPARGDVARR